MDANPACYWPCYDQRVEDEKGDPILDEAGKPVIEETGVCLQCISHKQHNGASRMHGLLDREFMATIISVVKYLLNSNVMGFVKAFADSLTIPNAKKDSETALYTNVRATIDRVAALAASALASKNGRHFNLSMQQIRLFVDPVMGLPPPAPCAQVRWATVEKSGASLSGVPGDLFAFGLARLRGYEKNRGY